MRRAFARITHACAGLAVALLAGNASANCREVGAQAGVPYYTTDWSFFTYYYSAVRSNYSSGTHYWQMSVPIDASNLNYNVYARFGYSIYTGNNGQPDVYAQAIAVTGAGEFYSATANVPANYVDVHNAAANRFLGTIGVPNGGTLMYAFTLPPTPSWPPGDPSTVVNVTYCF